MFLEFYGINRTINVTNRIAQKCVIYTVKDSETKIETQGISVEEASKKLIEKLENYYSQDI